MNDRIVVGVTGPSKGIPWAWWATRYQLQRAGVSARRLHAAVGYPGGNLDGIVIGGGNDIDPAIYGGDVSLGRSVDPQRDQYELAALTYAERRGIPVLGICRGAQLMNVNAGGSLVGDLRPHRKLTSNRGTILPRKNVQVVPNSRLAECLGSETTRVNSLHHQAVDRVGENFVVSAVDRDGIVQGIEGTRGRFEVGVQWHPEYMPQRKDQRRLFERFAAACRAHARSSDRSADDHGFDLGRYQTS